MKGFLFNLSPGRVLSGGFKRTQSALTYLSGSEYVPIHGGVQGWRGLKRGFAVTSFNPKQNKNEKKITYSCTRHDRNAGRCEENQDANQGTVVRQISNGTDNDLGGVITPDGNTIFFHRGEGLSSYSLWSYDRKTNLFSNYSRGMTV